MSYNEYNFPTQHFLESATIKNMKINAKSDIDIFSGTKKVLGVRASKLVGLAKNL